MNYRHAFHAGNFADVFKHAILARLLKALQVKDKGFAYIETHAGPGRYDLTAPEPRKTGEYRDGIGRLWDSPLPGLDDYLAAVRAVNRGERLRFYPGSPHVARFLLRPQDRMRVCEQVPADCARLRAEFGGDAQVSVRCGDGYAALASWLPPRERRGLVLIDPPYERPEEWERVYDALLLGAKRWAPGVYAVWYPIKTGAPVERFLRRMTSSGIRKILLAEIMVAPLDSPFRLNGCAMLVVNPPWRADAELRALVERLENPLKQGTAGHARVRWLVPE